MKGFHDHYDPTSEFDVSPDRVQAIAAEIDMADDPDEAFETAGQHARRLGADGHRMEAIFRAMSNAVSRSQYADQPDFDVGVLMEYAADGIAEAED